MQILVVKLTKKLLKNNKIVVIINKYKGGICH
jgi:hypothetical protein